MVQVAEDNRTRIEYAMKFYLSHKAYKDERGEHSNESDESLEYLSRWCSVCILGLMCA
jgi:hypothetical protein